LQMANIDLSVRDVNNMGRPLFIYANGTVEVTGKIDNSDQDPSGEGSWDVNVFARVLKLNSIDTRCLRTSSSLRNTGNINLRALAPPGYNPADGANNTAANQITVGGLLVSTNKWSDTNAYGQITTESVILQLQTNAILKTASTRIDLQVGKIQGGATAGDLFVNQSGGTYTPTYVVDWSGSIAPARPTLWLGTAPAGYLSLNWSGSGFVLQQNTNLRNASGWVSAPTGTTMPAILPRGSSNLYYRLLWPQ